MKPLHILYACRLRWQANVYRRTGRLSLILLFSTLGILLYGNTLHVPFYFDDIQNIRDNPDIHLVRLSPGNLFAAALKGGSSRRPVANISFALNYFWQQQKVAGFHLVNILVHIITGFFLFLLLKHTLQLTSFTGDHARKIALISALIWFVHPVQTQAVTFIVQRMTSMASMFYLISLFCYLRGRVEQDIKHSWPWFSASLLAAFLALGSKEIAITIPIIIYFYEWLIIRNKHLDRPFIIAAVISGIILFITMAIFFVFGKYPFDMLLAGYHYRDFNLTERLLTQFRVILFYISLLFYPHPSRLTLEHDFPLSHSLFDPVTTLPAIIAVFGTLAFSLFKAKKEPFLAFSMFWFFGNLVLESSILPLEIIFEHRLYLPSMFFIAAVTNITERLITPPQVKTILFILTLATFGFWTFERNKTWQHPLVFNQDMVQKAPAKARPRYNLGLALLEAQKPDEAITQFQMTIKLDPRMLEAYKQLASTFEKTGRHQEAIETYREVLWFLPDNAGILASLGRAYAQTNQFELAIQQFERSLQINPLVAETHNNLGAALQRQGKIQEAEQHYDEALRLNPDLAQAHNNKGLALAARKQYREAAEQFTEALRIEPQHAEAQHNLQVLKSKID